jgi:nicotinamidase/pyrazinamidase
MSGKAGLLVVDVQIDFCTGGALPVPQGDLVVPAMNRYLQLFWKEGCPIFASRDWHPADTRHFRKYGGLWPVHCVQNSAGARFHPELMLPEEAIVISAGMGRDAEGYSSFEGVDEHATPFGTLLRRMRVKKLYVGGLATDYCVKESVLDGLREGLQVTLLTDAVRGINLKPGDAERAIAEMVEAGAELANLESIGTELAEDLGSLIPPDRG